MAIIDHNSSPETLKSNCGVCGTGLVYLEPGTLKKIGRQLNPNFKTLATKTETSLQTVCPRCDAYALGIDMDTGFPFQTHEGEIKTIHDPAYKSLWN